MAHLDILCKNISLILSVSWIVKSCSFCEVRTCMIQDCTHRKIQFENCQWNYREKKSNYEHPKLQLTFPKAMFVFSLRSIRRICHMSSSFKDNFYNLCWDSFASKKMVFVMNIHRVRRKGYYSRLKVKILVANRNMYNFQGESGDRGMMPGQVMQTMAFL